MAAPTQRQRESQPTTTTRSGPAPATSQGAVQLKASLRGMGYQEQVAALAPDGADVQMHGEGGGAADVHAAAAAGTKGAGGSLPHGGAIQKAFGRHDVSGVQAYTGSAARDATSAMGASAYATGNKIAFGGQPDLHTAAHEAAHVVQQRAGVSLSGGVGKAGDSYEQHADQVADAVVAGQSAEPILDKMAGGGGATGVQRKPVDGHVGPVSSASVQMAKKGGGKNAKHANQDKREAAKAKYEEAKAQYEELKSKPNKTKDDKKAEAQAKREMQHWKRQMDFTGENHSQNAKGS